MYNCVETAAEKLPVKRSARLRPPGSIYWVTRNFEEHENLLGWGFGDEPEVDCMLSAAAAIVTVPPASQRTYS